MWRTRPQESGEEIWAEKSFRSSQQASNGFLFLWGRGSRLFSGIPDGNLKAAVEVAGERLQLGARTNFLTAGVRLTSRLRKE